MLPKLCSAKYIATFWTLQNVIFSWWKHTHSWIGRINAIKLAILPKLLYLFCTLPIPIPTFQLKSFQNLVTKWICSNKIPCITKHTIYNVCIYAKKAWALLTSTNTFRQCKLPLNLSLHVQWNSPVGKSVNVFLLALTIYALPWLPSQ